MKKEDLLIVAVLVALMFGWMRFYPEIERRFFPRPERPVEERVADERPAPAPAPVPEEPAIVAADAPVADVAPLAEEPFPDEPEERLVLANESTELTLTSHGGAIVSAVLKGYPAENRRDSGPVVLDFGNLPALRYDGMPRAAGTLERIRDAVVYRVNLGGGLVFERTMQLRDEYVLTVEESFINESTEVRSIPALRLVTGPMSNPEGTEAMRGVVTIGVDTFTPVTGVRHWGREFNKLFRDDPLADGLTRARVSSYPVDWIAAKSKFFVQILSAEDASGFDFSVRMAGEGRRRMPVEAAGALTFREETVGPGESIARTVRLYTGPKEYAALREQGMRKSDVMEFRSTGFWSFMNPVMYPLRIGLLWSLNTLHRGVRNYGVAIMLLTVLVRIIFWPITHKGTESMRRMQALQPQLKALQEKHKDNPQRMQQEVMKFYKENKVNPMGGCLPMLVQIPVFIALFTVLRSAIELRFSRFLWVSDLSEAENLFEGMIPIAGSLNILPILMAVTMMWQQKLTPTAGDPQQQKMMAVMMPVMMLFFFYSMPSGLVLYWTTSQMLMIVQMLYKKKKEV